MRSCTSKSCARPCPTLLCKLSRRATSPTLSREAASGRANALPIPDEAPVTSAHGPNRFLSIWVFMCVFSSCDSRPDPPQRPHHRPQAAPRLPLRFPVPPRLRVQPFPQGSSFSPPHCLRPIPTPHPPTQSLSRFVSIATSSGSPDPWARADTPCNEE